MLKITFCGKAREAEPLTANGLGLVCEVSGVDRLIVMEYMAHDKDAFWKAWQAAGGQHEKLVWEETGEPFTPPMLEGEQLVADEAPRMSADEAAIHATLVTAAIALIIGLLAFLLFSGCGVQPAGTPTYTTGTSNSGGFRTIVIDGCQYIEYSEGWQGSQHRVYLVTHKGNCNNPIHQYNSERSHEP